ncbi:MAG: hypothetical protein J6X12_04165 [Paludibacteraceae bacterium]|nr:hypothetical protein [Paludibacteraceae bacterium]
MEKSVKVFNCEAGISRSEEISKVFNRMVQKISESKQTSRKADENVSIAQKRPSCVFSFQIFNSEKERISGQSRLISNSNVSSEANCVFLHERKIEQRNTNNAYAKQSVNVTDTINAIEKGKLSNLDANVSGGSVQKECSTNKILAAESPIEKNLSAKNSEAEICDINNSSKDAENNICTIDVVPTVEKAKQANLSSNVKEDVAQEEHSLKDGHVTNDYADKNFVLKGSVVDVPDIKNPGEGLAKNGQKQEDVIVINTTVKENIVGDAISKSEESDDKEGISKKCNEEIVKNLVYSMPAEYEVKDVGGSGNCLFRSILFSLGQDPNTFMNLRKGAAKEAKDYLRHLENIRDKKTSDDDSIIGNINSIGGKNTNDINTIIKNLKSIIKEVDGKNQDTELYALPFVARHLKKAIVVYGKRDGKDCVQYAVNENGIEFTTNPNRIGDLLFQKDCVRIYHNGKKHFQAIRVNENYKKVQNLQKNEKTLAAVSDTKIPNKEQNIKASKKKPKIAKPKTHKKGKAKKVAGKHKKLKK